MTSAGYLRYPHVHDDLLVFVAEDDVWLAPADGGRAWRLSADSAAASHPRFSPDGATVAWTSLRDGDPEVYAADAAGSAATRITYWSAQRTRVTGWTAQGDVLAVTSAGQGRRQFTWAYAIPLEGAPPRRLPYGPVWDLAVAAAGTALLTGLMNTEPAHWKRYRGGSAGKLWTSTAADPLFQRVLGDLNGQFHSPMVVGDRLVFISDHEGIGNIYSVPLADLGGTDLRRHTDHDGLYVRNASTDGTRVVYHLGGDIWILDHLDAQTRRVDITLGSPAAARAPRLITAAQHLEDLDCDQTGQASAITVRGTVHWLTHKDGPARALYVRPDARARLPRVLGDSGKVVWVTDEGGSDSLAIGGGTAEQPLVVIQSSLLGGVISLAASPDGATVAAAAHDGKLLLADIASGEVTEVAASDDGPVTGLAWSPDSAWLAWSQPGPQPLSAIRMVRVADRFVANVTDARFADTDPAFTPDGLYLAFLSRRSFDPVYDAQSFDLSFPFGARPYLVTLAAQTPSPFGPLPGGRPVNSDPAASDKNGSSERAVLRVEAEGIGDRVVPVPVEEARYSHLRAIKGGLAWLREPLSGMLGESAADIDDGAPRPVLERFDFRSKECTELVGALDWFDVSKDGARLVVKDHGRLRVLGSEHKEDSESSTDAVTVDLARARFEADPAALWRHAYGEAGRLMRRDYWTPTMSGVDWDGVLDEYRPLLDRIRSADDFIDLLWEIFGELGTSHAYALSADYGSDGGSESAVGLLGADISRDQDGAWAIDRVLPGESSDPRARSPLAAPGAAIRAGDTLVAVDGRAVDAVRGPWPLLAGTAGKPVELTVRSAGEVRRVVVVPLRSDLRLRYQDWVIGPRRLVRELSDGRLGYLHVPDMVAEGWAHFHRDLRSELGRDGLILDVRGNSGGEISELVVEKVARRIIGWDAVRGMHPVSYPREARRGAMVTLADEFAGSDGDIVTAAIKVLGLGPVVGTRTWGGVIGIDGIPGHQLADGTHMTVPKYAFSFHQYGWGVENYGVAPDIEVLITPDDWAAGRDPQLETAVRLALEAVAGQPRSGPPDPATAPNKKRPPLPPRPNGTSPAAGTEGGA